MNVIKFPVSTTNIFPLANSKKGGQLLTEFNLKSRDSVGTNPNIKYFSGPSFVHSLADFEVTRQLDGGGNLISSTAIQIAPGIGVIDGHFVESLTPIIVDIAELNAQINADATGILNDGKPLKGRLVVGLRIMYSTTATMNGSMLTENEDELYEGIQVVVCAPEDFKLPEDEPTDKNKVTAHLKLAEFTYRNGAVMPDSIVNNEDKIKYIDSERLKNIESFLSSIYITKAGLIPGKLYVYAGKGKKNGQISPEDTWCDATNDLVDWGQLEETLVDPEAETGFITGLDGTVYFVAARKQVDGYVTGANQPIYFAPVTLPLPVADFSNNTPGTVTAEYTKHVKDVINRINEFYHLPSGKMRAYYSYFPLSGKEGREDSLPIINPDWTPGDFILVREDNTVDSATSPSTIYVVTPGVVTGISSAPNRPEGVRLDYLSSTEDPTDIIQLLDVSNIYYFKWLRAEPSDWETDYNKYYRRDDSVEPAKLIRLTEPVEFEYDKFFEQIELVDPVAPGVPAVSSSFVLSNYSGVVGSDYFQYDKLDADGNVEATYYFVVSSAGQMSYSDPVILTGYMQLATQDQIGGFYDVDESAIDQGYVKVTADGRLQLLDYALLRSGVLAYQLGQNYTIDGTNLEPEAIQSALNDYVNNRVAFPNATQIANAQASGANPNIITLTLSLPKLEDNTEFYIQGIDSRFGSVVELNIVGEADEHTIINILDCEKVKINNVIGGTPTINLYRCGLYYDSHVLNELNIIEDMHLWYQQFSADDPDLTVNDMTVSATGDPITTEELEIWNAEYANDNHFRYGLQSVTFDGSGNIVGVGIFIANNTTSNVNNTASGLICSDFALPQGQGLTYPLQRLKYRLKITGEFVSTYSTRDGWITTDARFSAVTNTYDAFSTRDYATGKIAIYFTTEVVDSVFGDLEDNAIDNPFYPGTYHIFKGGILGGDSQ